MFTFQVVLAILFATGGIVSGLPATLNIAPREVPSFPSVRGVKCGGVKYTSYQITKAATEAATRLSNGKYLYNGATRFPHKFNNAEGITFITALQRPYYEFPLIKGEVYTGGSPGPDRVVIAMNSKGVFDFVDAITHAGAGSLSGFKKCV